jgi:hypothetical protein
VENKLRVPAAIIAQGHTAPDFLNPIVFTVCTIIGVLMGLKGTVDMISGKIDPQTGRYASGTVSRLPERIVKGIFGATWVIGD